MTNQSDRVIRAMTDDGAFRVIAVRMTDTVAEAIRVQGATGTDATLFAELMVANVLTRETMSPGHRTQASIRDGYGGQLFVDSHPGGLTRGVRTAPNSEDHLKVDEGSLLKCVRVLYSGELHESITAMPESGDVSDAFMGYMQISEQVASFIRVACLIEAGQVRACGGFIVQLLPDVTREPLDTLTRRLEGIGDFGVDLRAVDADPEVLLESLLDGFEYTVLDTGKVHFGCLCDSTRLLSAVAALGREDVEEIVKRGEPLQISCDYCHSVYEMSPHQLGSLLDAS
jgi:molecular chaperone Hsp33